MVSVFSPVKEMAAAEYLRVTEVTYLGYVYGTQAALRRAGTLNVALMRDWRFCRFSRRVRGRFGCRFGHRCCGSKGGPGEDRMVGCSRRR